MTFLSLVARQVLRFGQAVGFYLCVVTVSLLLAMILMAFAGYAPFSDRPGPGWYGSKLAAIPLATVLFVFHDLLRVVRTPRWALVAVCGTVSLFVSGYLLLATGWYIAISGVIPILGGRLDIGGTPPRYLGY